MSSPISLSNFNSIDFSVILNAVMAQNSQPLTALQTKQTELATESQTYNVLATKLGSLESAAVGLSTPGRVAQYSTTLSDAGSIAVAANGDAIPGTYDVVVSKLAKSQVSASLTTAVNADTAAVGEGTLNIGGFDVVVSGSVTLAALASQINSTTQVVGGVSTPIPVTASVVQSAPGEYRLVLTSKSTGQTNGFAVTGDLTTTDGSGTHTVTSFGTALTNPPAQDAVDAEVTINGIKIKSASNTLSSAIPGTTLSLLHADLDKITTVSVGADDAGLTSNVTSFISAYNDVIAFITDQKTQAGNGVTGTLAHEALLGQARSALRAALGGGYGSGTFSHLAEVGIGFNRTGQLTLDSGALSAALTKDRSSVATLFAGTTTNSSGFTNGAFGTIQSALDDFTRTGGFVSAAQSQLNNQGTRLDSQIGDMVARLAIQRTTLQAQFTAADAAMSQLKSQSGTLASVSGLVTN